jgi:Ca2+/Na+ antiporter
MEWFKKWLLIMRDLFRIYIPVALVLVTFAYPFLSDQQKAQLQPIAIVVIPILAVAYLIISFHMSYSVQQAVYEREKTIKDVVGCIGKGEVLKSRIGDSWTMENSEQLPGEVNDWEAESERAIGKYYNEFISVFRLTGDPERHFNPRSPQKIDLRNRMLTKTIMDP